MKTRSKFPSMPRRRQAGVALITGLIFMVVLTLLAIAAMRTTTLEELMARNARDRDLAFQAAEAALRAGEQVVLEGALPASPSSGTWYTPRIVAGTLTTYWQNTHDWGAQSVAAWQPAGTSAAPQFVVEDMGATACAGGSLAIGPVPDCGVYRVTARGVGSSANTFVILQAVYRL